MGAVRKVASYLGLGGTEHYDESYDYEDEVEGEEEDWQPASERAAKRWRAMTEPSRIVMLTPRKYNDAPIIGRHFREGQTVIMDVNGMSTAEVAFIVADIYQGHGIGTFLMDALAVAAHVGGVTRFTARVLSDNYAMRAIMNRAGAHWVRDDLKVVITEVDVPPAKSLSLRPEMYEEIAEMARRTMRAVS